MELDEIKNQYKDLERLFKGMKAQGPTLEGLKSDVEQLQHRESELLLKVDQLTKENNHLNEKVSSFKEENVLITSRHRELVSKVEDANRKSQEMQQAVNLHKQKELEHRKVIENLDGKFNKCTSKVED